MKTLIIQNYFTIFYYVFLFLTFEYLILQLNFKIFLNYIFSSKIFELNLFMKNA